MSATGDPPADEPAAGSSIGYDPEIFGPAAAGATSGGSVVVPDPASQTSVATVKTGGMTIRLLYDAAATAAPASFRAGIEAAAAILSSTISDHVTVNLKIDYSGTGGGAFAGPDAGLYENYAFVRSALVGRDRPYETTYDGLPAASTLQGQSLVAVWNAQLKLMGVLGANDTTTDDGSAYFSTDISPGLLVGVALHELTHALGRIPFGPRPDIFDLYRFTAANTRLFNGSTTSAPAAYFSVDGGTTKLADYGRTSDTSDFLNSGTQGSSDPFNEFYSGGTQQALSAIDIAQLNALGYHTSLMLGSNGAGTRWTNSYDSLDRLTSQAGTRPDGTTWTNAYDGLSRLAKTTNLDSHGALASITTYDPGNLQGYSFFTDTYSGGRLVSETGTRDDGSTWINTYNAAGRLAATGNYDLQGHVASTVVFDAANGQGYSFYTDNYDSQGHLVSQSGTRDDGSGWTTVYDVANQQGYSAYTNDYDSAGRLLTQVGTRDDGTTWSTHHDVDNRFGYSSYTDNFDGGGHLLSQSGLRDDGGSWATTYDVANQQGYSYYTENFDAGGHRLSQAGMRDDGTSWVTTYDAANQQGYSAYTNEYDTAGRLVLQVGTSDNGVSWTNSYAAAGGLSRSTLTGTTGNDTIVGNGAPDVIVGGAGADVLTAGSGPATFAYRAPSDSTAALADLITNFRHGIDQIDFTTIAGLDATNGVPRFQGALAGPGNLFLDAHSVAFLEAGGTTVVVANTSALAEIVTTADTHHADMTILLTGLHLGLTAGDFHIG